MLNYINRFCTYINDNSKAICEICSKTNKKLKKSHKNSRKPFANENKTKVNEHCDKSNVKCDKSECQFDESLINEQKEIERELIRRLENERRIDRQNERIARKEEYMRRKSLGLPIDDQLKDAIKKDQEEETIDMEKDSVESVIKLNDDDVKQTEYEVNNIQIIIKNSENPSESDPMISNHDSSQPNKVEESIGLESKQKESSSSLEDAAKNNDEHVSISKGN